MSIQSFEKFEKIIMYLSVLRYIFKSRTKKGLYDLNKKAEPFFNRVLNIVFGWNLIHLNEIQSNYPAIDLGDSSNKVCVQVTAENTSTKIVATIDKFIEKELYKTYSRLIILIITDKKNYTTTFNTHGKFVFSMSEDIKDVDDLLTDIEKFGLDKLSELDNYLKKELTAIIAITAVPDSLFARAEEKIDLPPVNGERLFTDMGFVAGDYEVGLKSLKKFYSKLTSLSRNTREYLCAIIIYGSSSSCAGSNDICIQAKHLENKLRMERADSIEEFNILNEAGLASIDESDGKNTITSGYSMRLFGINLLACLKDYAKKDEAILKKILVDCDFTILDA